MEFNEFFLDLKENFRLIKKKLKDDKIFRFVKQFKYLTNYIDQDGKLIDPFLNHSLEFQYHYSFLLFSWFLLKKVVNIKNIEQKLFNSFKYWSNLPDESTKHSLEFNNFASCLSYAVLKYLVKPSNDVNLIKDILEEKINHLKHNKYSNLIPLNNNFKALTAINLYLQGNLIKDRKKVEQGISLMRSKIVNFQMDDCFFPDTNMSKTHHLEKNNGVPHLTYHSKIAMLVAFLGILSGDKAFQESSIKAFETLIDISSIDGESCFYGRSQNSLFGYACIFLGLNLIYKYLRTDKKYLNFCNKILRLVQEFQLSNGFFTINFNRNMENYPGYDDYMYSIVYNTYANSLFIFGLIINPALLDFQNTVVESKFRSNLYKESGFFKVKTKELELCLNLKGHLNCHKYYMDSRLAPLTLQYLYYNDIDLIPSVPIKNNFVNINVHKPTIFEKLKNKKHNIGYNPAIGGFQPFFMRKSIILKSKFLFNLLINLNSYFLARLNKFQLNDSSIDLNYIVRRNEENISSLEKLVKKLSLSFRGQKIYFNKKVNIRLGWDNNSIEYFINGPNNMLCIFPLRFYKKTIVQKKSNKSINLCYKGLTILISTNKEFKIIKSYGKFNSGKGESFLLFLQFYQSNNLIIKVKVLK